MKSLLRALAYLKKYWLAALGAFIGLVFSSAMNLAIPAMMQRIIDRGIAARAISVIVWTSAAMVGMALLRAQFTFLQGYLSARASQGVAYDLRNALYQKIQKLSFSYHDRAQTGQLLTRATNDVERVRMFVGMGFVQLLSAVLMIIGSLALLFSLDWQLALIMLVIMALAMVVFAQFARRARPLFTKVQQKLSALNTVLQENLAGIRVVKAFAREPFERERFAAVNQELLEQSVQVGKMLAAVIPLIFLIANLGTLAVIWVGGLEVIGGRLTIGELVAFNNYVMMAMFPMFMLGMIMAMISQAGASAERVFEILDAQSEVVEKPEWPSFEQMHPSPQEMLTELLRDMMNMETSRVGMLLLIARLAEEEGESEIAAYLRQMSHEELNHAIKISGLLKEMRTLKESLRLSLIHI